MESEIASLANLRRRARAKKRERDFCGGIFDGILAGTKISKVISLMGDAYDTALKACSWPVRPYSHIRMHL